MAEPILNNSTGFDEGKATGTFFFGIPPNRGGLIGESHQQPQMENRITHEEELNASAIVSAAQKRQKETIRKASSYWTSAGLQNHFSSGMRKKKMPVISMKLMRLLDKASQDGPSTDIPSDVLFAGEPQSPSSPFGSKKTRKAAKTDSQERQYEDCRPNTEVSLSVKDTMAQPKLSLKAHLHDVKFPDRIPALDFEREREPQRRKAMSDGGRVLESRGAAKLSPLAGPGNEFSFGFLKEMGLLGVRDMQEMDSYHKRLNLRQTPTEKLSGIGELSTEFSTNEAVSSYLYRQNVPRSAGNPLNSKVFEMPVPAHSTKHLQPLHVQQRDLKTPAKIKSDHPYSIPFSKVDSYKLLPKALDLELLDPTYVQKVGITQSLPPSTATTPVSCAPTMNGVDFVKAMRNKVPPSSAPTDKMQPARPPKLSFGESFFLVGSSGHKRVFIDMKTDTAAGKGFPHSTSEKGYKHQFQVPLVLGRTEVSGSSSGNQHNQYHRFIKHNLYRSPDSKPRVRTDSSQLEHSGDNSSLFVANMGPAYRQANSLPKISPTGIALSRSGSRKPQIAGLLGGQTSMKSEQELLQVNMSIRKVKPFFKEEKRLSDHSTAEEALNRSIHTKMDLLHLKYKEKAAQLGSKRKPAYEPGAQEEQFYHDQAIMGDSEPQNCGPMGQNNSYNAGVGGFMSQQPSKHKFSLARGYQPPSTVIN